MKTEIHPEYVESHVSCTCGNEFTTRSTEAEIHVEICSNCHPFYTGKQKLVDTGGRVERFQPSRRQARRLDELTRSDPRAPAASRRPTALPRPALDAEPRQRVATRDAPVGGQAVLEGVMMRGVSHVGGRGAQARARPARDERARARRRAMPRSARSTVADARSSILQAPPRCCGCRSSAASSPSASRWRSGSRRSGSRPTRRCPRRRSRSPAAGSRTVVFALVLSRSACSSWSRSTLTNLIKDQLGSACCSGWSRGPAHHDLPRLPRADLAHARPAARVRVPRRRAQDDLLLRGGAELTPENAQRFSRLHPRCGTSFLLIVMIVAIFVFSPLGLPPWWALIASRVVGVPIIAGISFELIKLAGKHRRRRWVKALMWPGHEAPAADDPRARPHPARRRDRRAGGRAR